MEEENKAEEVVRIIGWNFVSSNSSWRLIGFDLKKNKPRLSSTIVKIELLENIITTCSGRRYRPINSPGKLHPMAEIYLHSLSESQEFDYTIEFLNVPNNKKQFTSHRFQKAPYLEYKNKVYELLGDEFRDISAFQHHLAWMDDKCIFIGKSDMADEDENEDELALWENFALSQENSKEVQDVFVEQKFAKYSATIKASKLIEQGRLSEIVIDPSIKLIFTKALWQEVCFLFSEMTTNVIADNSLDHKYTPALTIPSSRQMISWVIDENILFDSSKWLPKPLLETFNSHDYISEILKHHYQVINRFNIKYELNANV